MRILIFFAKLKQFQNKNDLKQYIIQILSNYNDLYILADIYFSIFNSPPFTFKELTPAELFLFYILHLYRQIDEKDTEKKLEILIDRIYYTLHPNEWREEIIKEMEELKLI